MLFLAFIFNLFQLILNIKTIWVSCNTIRYKIHTLTFWFVLIRKISNMSPVTIINYLIKSCPTLEAHFYRTVYLKKRKCNKIEVLRRLNVRSHLFRNQYFCVLPLRCFKVIQHMNNVTITPLKSSNMRIVENIIFVKVVLVKTYTKSILFTFSTNFRTNN